MSSRTGNQAHLQLSICEDDPASEPASACWQGCANLTGRMRRAIMAHLSVRDTAPFPSKTMDMVMPPTEYGVIRGRTQAVVAFTALLKFIREIPVGLAIVSAAGRLEDVMGKTKSDQLSIFLSHKHEDYEVAKTIVKELETYGASKIKFYLSKEIPVGKNWSDWIKENVADASWFMLLFTNPTSSWDWCLFEAGLFRAGMAGESRLICMYHEDVKIPEQLSKFQGVRADQEGIREFLCQLYGKPVADGLSVINPNLVENDDAMEALTDKIYDAMKIKGPDTKIESYYYNKYLNLHLDSDDTPPSDETLREATLESKSNFEDIFGITILPKTWGDLTDLIKEQNKKEDRKNEALLWLDQLYQSIKNADKGVTFHQGHALIQGLSDQNLYRPILHCMRRPTENKTSSWDFEVLFVEWESDSNIGGKSNPRSH